MFSNIIILKVFTNTTTFSFEKNGIFSDDWIHSILYTNLYCVLRDSFIFVLVRQIYCVS